MTRLLEQNSGDMRTNHASMKSSLHGSACYSDIQQWSCLYLWLQSHGQLPGCSDRPSHLATRLAQGLQFSDSHVGLCHFTGRRRWSSRAIYGLPATADQTGDAASLIALDVQTGKTNWQVSITGQNYSSVEPNHDRHRNRAVVWHRQSVAHHQSDGWKNSQH